MKSALEPSVPLLCVRDLCAEFGDFALQDIALEVWANERVGIVGESGSGKSLLAKLLMGLVQGNERGEIRFQGIEQNLATIPINSPLWRTIRAQKIAYIPQSPKLSLNPLHTIGKQLAEMCALHLPHTPKAKYQTLIDQALESVGLESTLKHRLPHTLSGGQAQRVCIAMMSLARPRLLICDEPTTALDAHIQSQILALLDSFTEMAIVFITHDLGLIGRFAGRVYVMQGGKICDHLNIMDSACGLESWISSPRLCDRRPSLISARGLKSHDSSSTILESKSDLGDCALSSHFADLANFGTTADSCSAPKFAKNYESPTAIPRILEEESRASCSSLRALREQSVAIHKSTQVDSSAKMDCHATASAVSRNDDENTQNMFSQNTAGGRIFDEKVGLCSGEQGDKTCGLSPQRDTNSPLFRKKPTPKPNQAQFSSQAKTTHPYTRKLLAAITLPKKVDSSAGEVCLDLRDFAVYYTTKGFFTRRKTLAIQGVNLRLRAGDSIGIIGASGSGKSSLALGILGLEGHSGELCLPNAAQEPLIYTSTKRDKAFVSMVQIVFQDPLLALNPRMCVLEILQEALQARESYKAKKAKALTPKAIELLEQVGLSSSFLYRYSHTLSGGEAQRVCIARALASGARILLLDEPTSALDKSTQKDIITLLIGLQCALGLSYIVISHDLNVIEAMCAEVIVLDSGQVVEQGAVAQVFSAPIHPCTRALLQARI
ncbi:ATP-binding cassette domain-containing protein [Helicobacter canis]|uniref:ABC transporter ATP-binding protein n=1 Tax=Helicobacter canis TaxID=29419 RepID=A0A5M9QN88_9HELI|nr:ABC transporter ATP-binding protein [Helicobacter canis]KAA8709858.1 ABC transporter ATP-binding protein [Helicobacter canis]